MKIFLSILAVAAISLSCITLSSDGLEIGAVAPEQNLKMTSITGEELSLTDIKKDNGLLVVFSCNTCPFVVGNGEKSEGWEGRYNGLFETATANNIGMVLVNSNEAKREGADSMEEMIAHAKDQNYMSPYVLDKDHKLADAFGAKTTPHVYLFDAKLKLVYAGAIDDNVGRAEEVKETYLSNAIQNMIKGIKIDPNSTKPLGCSIKRVKV